LQAGADSFQRFESRAGHYARHRATYPAALIDCLAQAQGWRAGLTVADVGSGTGIFTRQVLERGPRVLAAERSCGSSHFKSALSLVLRLMGAKNIDARRSGMRQSIFMAGQRLWPDSRTWLRRA
jgi:hypothetical protein